MKCFLVLCLLGLVSLSMADTEAHSRGCIYIEGRCFKECPEGTHSYTTGCSPIMPEATCDQPHPVLEEDDICDYSECYCDSPNVRDKKTNKCVPLDQCTKNTQQEENKDQQDVQEEKSTLY